LFWLYLLCIFPLSCPPMWKNAWLIEFLFKNCNWIRCCVNILIMWYCRLLKFIADSLLFMVHCQIDRFRRISNQYDFFQCLFYGDSDQSMSSKRSFRLIFFIWMNRYHFIQCLSLIFLHFWKWKLKYICLLHSNWKDWFVQNFYLWYSSLTCFFYICQFFMIFCRRYFLSCLVEIFQHFKQAEKKTRFFCLK
jgi:hypothetical protein